MGQYIASFIVVIGLAYFGWWLLSWVVSLFV